MFDILLFHFSLQKASEAINRGISLWLPQLRSADQPDGATAVDPVQVHNLLATDYSNIFC